MQAGRSVLSPGRRPFCPRQFLAVVRGAIAADEALPDDQVLQTDLAASLPLKFTVLSSVASAYRVVVPHAKISVLNSVHDVQQFVAQALDTPPVQVGSPHQELFGRVPPPSNLRLVDSAKARREQHAAR